MKQDKTSDSYAIHADKSIFKEYRTKNRVKVLHYAARVRNDSVIFEISRKAVRKTEKDRGFGKAEFHLILKLVEIVAICLINGRDVVRG